METPDQMPAAASAPPPKKRWPLSSLLLFGLAAILGVLAVLLWTGAIKPLTTPPPVTPGAIRTVDVVSTLRSAGVSAEENPRLFVPRREFEVPGQGIMVEGNPMLLFVFPDREAAEAAVAAADPTNILPARLPGDIEVAPDDVLIAQGSNVAVALVGGDERTRDTVRSTIEGLP
jgi:hypothetical protein